MDQQPRNRREKRALASAARRSVAVDLAEPRSRSQRIGKRLLAFLAWQWPQHTIPQILFFSFALGAAAGCVVTLMGAAVIFVLYRGM